MSTPTISADTTAQNATSTEVREDVNKRGNIDNYIYGPDERVTTYFVREIRPCAAFSKLPVLLTNGNGMKKFGGTFTMPINASGDYLLSLTAYATLSAGTITGAGDASVVSWLPKLGHKLIKSVKLKIDGKPLVELSSSFMDMWSEFMIDSGNYEAYNNMVGGEYEFNKDRINNKSVVLPIPMYFSRDTGIALPIGAMVNNRVTVEFVFRKVTDLLVLENKPATGAGTGVVRTLTEADFSVVPTIASFEVVADFAVVTDFEIDRTSCTPHYMYMEKPVDVPATELVKPTDGTTAPDTMSFEIEHTNGIVKALFFGVRNITRPEYLDFYKVGLPRFNLGAREDVGTATVSRIGIKCNDKYRVPLLPSEHFVYTEPYHAAKRVPTTNNGLYMYSFALDLHTIDPKGSINPSNFNSNISVVLRPSETLNAATTERFEFNATVLTGYILYVENGNLRKIDNGGDFN
ncbi:50.9 kDa Major capsid protein [Spodoptera frugiperda ascovirus 1a]|uniref:Major capsid protein n=1 Tax=Spodoptera frugiperda ascovirus 1a TaxID=113370 RepID=CAPSD_SFAVA|nr:50.9 kDa Major capsid protein [Spodoptera frugiperda ascovirus 1a]Q8JJY5.1 RecName: Full=Major capsid protein [Spodoptera frugiperda ascovirus 1a]CAC84465.1 major capsid protein [Spodoptera frugiperda ascovirus 1a]CAL44641.1 50.9 kDa Major capsid protein [Spodoptera frugiperda ascovirus 1a]